MKAITPFAPVFNKPQATQLLVRSINDNLVESCIFYYELQTDDGQVVYNGNVPVAGSDYANWNGDNNFPYTFTAAQLGLTITP